MSIRKREWTTPSGERRTSWLVDYRDNEGKRRAKQFARKRDADAFELTARSEVRGGIHTPDGKSITVALAAANWIRRGEREGLEESTLKPYGQHVRLHINPFLGTKKLNQLTRPMIEDFRDQLLDTGRSRPMAKRVLTSLSSIVKEAMRVGHVAQNVCDGVTVKRSGRDKVRVAPPSKADMRKLIEAAATKRPMDKPLLMVLLFAGLRASEARALSWRHVDLQKARITIDQRADFRNLIGPPKSASGFRTIPVPAAVVSELRKWKLRCPPSKLDLVFPSRGGTPIFHPNLVLGFQEPVQIAAGLTRPVVRGDEPAVDEDGQPIVKGRYTLHDFRHAAASMWIEQRVPAKRVQTWMGHHSIQVTFDTYGHLFEAIEDDDRVMAALENGVFGSPAAEGSAS